MGAVLAEAIRLLAAGAWGGVRRAFLGIFSIRGRLHAGFWAKGGRQGAHSVENERFSRHRGLRIGVFGAVLRADTRSRGLRDAEYSGICTVPTGVPAGKRRPPRQSIHSAGRFMQNSDCRCASSSLEPESRNSLLGALEGADHVNLIERSVGGEVDDDRKAEGKHHGKHVAQRLDLNVKVQ